jgi:hypothetical protein
MTTATIDAPETASPTSPKRAAWGGPIGLEGTPTGDGRLISRNALRWTDLPLPLRWAESDHGAHTGAQVVGWIRDIERLSLEDANTRLQERGLKPLMADSAALVIWGKGDFDLGGTSGQEAFRQVNEELTCGISMDLDDIEIVEGEDESYTIPDARVRAATLLAIPAFEGAKISIERSETVDADVDTFNWVEEAGGLPAYIKEIAKSLQKRGFDKSRAIATAINAVKRWAAGGPAREGGEGHVNPDTQAKAAAALAEWEAKKATHNAETVTLATEDLDALLASAVPAIPKREWFEDPGLPGPTALTVTDEGRVFGHLALWDTCHIANPNGQGVCTRPPRSNSQYAYFHTGVTETDAGDVPTGRLTMSTVHAGPRMTAHETALHYEFTGATAADVVAGEDNFGIWVAGAARPDADLRTLRSHPISGDWRVIRGGLELVGTLSVNVPGFPVPRARALVASGQVQSLIVEDRISTMTNQDRWTRLQAFAADQRFQRVQKMQADLRLSRLAEKVATFREYDTKQREKKAESGVAMPDGSFPIADTEDLKNAIKAVGRAKDPEAAKAHIKKRAKVLKAEAMLPDDWAAGTETLAYNPDQWRVPKGNGDRSGRFIDMPDNLLSTLDAVVTNAFDSPEVENMDPEAVDRARAAADAASNALRNKDGAAAQLAANDLDTALVDLDNEMGALADTHPEWGEEQAESWGEAFDAAYENNHVLLDSDLSLLGDESIGEGEEDLIPEGEVIGEGESDLVDQGVPADIEIAPEEYEPPEEEADLIPESQVAEGGSTPEGVDTDGNITADDKWSVLNELPEGTLVEASFDGEAVGVWAKQADGSWTLHAPDDPDLDGLNSADDPEVVTAGGDADLKVVEPTAGEEEE